MSEVASATIWEVVSACIWAVLIPVITDAMVDEPLNILNVVRVIAARCAISVKDYFPKDTFYWCAYECFTATNPAT
jgi:hypothetical protein